MNKIQIETVCVHMTVYTVHTVCVYSVYSDLYMCRSIGTQIKKN